MVDTYIKLKRKSPDKQTSREEKEASPYLSDGLSHCYVDRCYPPLVVKLACTRKWVKVENRGKNNSKYFSKSDARQWHIDCGYNSTCPECLIEYGKRASRKLNVTFYKLGISSSAR